MIHVCATCKKKFTNNQPKSKACSTECKRIYTLKYYRKDRAEKIGRATAPKFIPDYRNEVAIPAKRKKK